jgi:seryl-tRNA synthetase
MHDIKFIRDNKELFDQGIKDRGIQPCAEEILHTYDIVRQNKMEIQELQRQRKALAKEMSMLKPEDARYKELKLQGHDIKHKLPASVEREGYAMKKLEHFLTTLPNMAELDVPYGDGEENNKIIRVIGKPRSFDFNVRSHYEIGRNLGMMDFETAAKISGSRFVILKQDLVRLERALASFMLDVHSKEFGYEEVSPPALVLENTMFKAGQLPKFEDDSFKTTNGYRLIPTSEVPLICMAADKIMSEHELPLRYVGYTQCFRSEAGSAGRDTKGMIRQHQFSKVELISIVLPKDSKAELERVTTAAESILQKLELPYRVLLLCTKDMGFCAQKTYDLEVWLPHEKRYREISSCSNCGSFQARRMNARYKSLKDGKNQLVHTLNGSGLAVGRTMIAIIENYQNEDGSISIPAKLQQYMQNQKIINNTND